MPSLYENLIDSLQSFMNVDVDGTIVNRLAILPKEGLENFVDAKKVEHFKGMFDTRFRDQVEAMFEDLRASYIPTEKFVRLSQASLVSALRLINGERYGLYLPEVDPTQNQGQSYYFNAAVSFLGNPVADANRNLAFVGNIPSEGLPENMTMELGNHHFVMCDDVSYTGSQMKGTITELAIRSQRQMMEHLTRTDADPPATDDTPDIYVFRGTDKAVGIINYFGENAFIYESMVDKEGPFYTFGFKNGMQQLLNTLRGPTTSPEFTRWRNTHAFIRDIEVRASRGDEIELAKEYYNEMTRIRNNFTYVFPPRTNDKTLYTKRIPFHKMVHFLDSVLSGRLSHNYHVCIPIMTNGAKNVLTQSSNYNYHLQNLYPFVKIRVHIQEEVRPINVGAYPDIAAMYGAISSFSNNILRPVSAITLSFKISVISSSLSSMILGCGIVPRMDNIFMTGRSEFNSNRKNYKFFGHDYINDAPDKTDGMSDQHHTVLHLLHLLSIVNLVVDEEGGGGRRVQPST